MTEHRTPYAGSSWSYLDNRPQSVWAGLIGCTVEIEWAPSADDRLGGAKHLSPVPTRHEVLAADETWVRLRRAGSGLEVVVRLCEIEFATLSEDPPADSGRGGQPVHRAVA